ncbi:MAG: GumC family protein [Alphaproteobacteria bacterium]
MNVVARIGGSNSLPDNTLSAADTQEPRFDIGALLQLLRARRKLIAGTVIGILLVVAAITFQLTPLYTGTALVMLNQRKETVVDVDAVLSGLPSDQATIQSQVQILKSRNLAERVIKKTGLMRDPEFNSGATRSWLSIFRLLNPSSWIASETVLSNKEKAEAEINAVIDRLTDHLSVSPVGLSLAITMSVQSADPVKAARLANAYADAYIEDQLETKLESTERATRWLARRLEELKGQVETAEAAVAQYKADHNLTETIEGTSITEAQLGQINSQLILARSALAEQEAKLSRVHELQRQGRMADVSQVVDSPFIAQLRAQETEFLRREAELVSKYGPRHPKMLDLASEKSNLQAKIWQEIRRVVQTVENGVAEARARVSSLEASLNQTETKTGEQNQARVQLKVLEANAASTRALYDAFLSRFKQTQDQEGIQTPDARILSHADVPKRPSFPNFGLVFGIAFPVSLLMGFAVARIAETLDNGFRTTGQVERLLGIPVLATIPEIEVDTPADHVVTKPLSSFAESIRSLLIGLALSNVDRKPKVILVTSSAPGEGKTTVSVALARQAAQNNQDVVLVDADLRHPNVANVLGAKDAPTGLADVLSGRIPISDGIHKDPQSALRFLPASHEKVAIPPDLLASKAFEQLIAVLKSRSDLVIIDSCPLLPVNDTRLIAGLADTVVFVSRWEKTPRDAAAAAMRLLADSGVPVAGSVLTRCDVSRFHYYNYGYKGYYGSPNYAAYYQE